jgi:hypothetical protein
MRFTCGCNLAVACDGPGLRGHLTEPALSGIKVNSQVYPESKYGALLSQRGWTTLERCHFYSRRNLLSGRPFEAHLQASYAVNARSLVFTRIATDFWIN